MLLPVTLTIAADSPEGDAAGYVLLTQGTRTRRIPYWAHVERPRLAAATAHLLRRPGIVRGSTRGQPDRVERYRYPAYNGALGLPVRWKGGEALYRFHLSRRAINVGVTVEAISGGGPAAVPDARRAGREPPRGRVRPADRRRPVADGRSGAVDGPLLGAARASTRWRSTRRSARGGAFRLRFWVNDVTPPALGRLRVSEDARTLRIPVTDAGSGVDPRYLECALVEQGSSADRTCRPDWDARTGIASIAVGRLPRRPLRARRARGRLRRVARRAGDRHQPAARAHARDRTAGGCARRHPRRRCAGRRLLRCQRRQVDGG